MNPKLKFYLTPKLENFNFCFENQILKGNFLNPKEKFKRWVERFFNFRVCFGFSRSIRFTSAHFTPFRSAKLHCVPLSSAPFRFIRLVPRIPLAKNLRTRKLKFFYFQPNVIYYKTKQNKTKQLVIDLE